MRIDVILNREGGTLRTLDIEAFGARLREELEAAGHQVWLAAVDGAGIEPALDAAVKGDCDVVMVGGGDGTVSASAGKLMNTGKALAILPAGTMNLFARSLGLPLQLDAAITALAGGNIRAVDLATANGRVFVHQFSIGLHAKLIRLRERQAFTSRLGKIRASMQAGLAAFLRPPVMRVSLMVDDTEITVATSGIGVTNNLFGEGHLPYADDPAGGTLGVYITRARRRRDLIVFLAKMALGRWRGNDQVEILTADTVRMRIDRHSRRFGCAMDGELCDLASETELMVHPGSLKVLVPAV